jgi:membrane-associated protein
MSLGVLGAPLGASTMSPAPRVPLAKLPVGGDSGVVLDLLQRIGEHVGAWLYLIAGGLAFAEAAILVGVVFPGEVALLVAGFSAHQGWLSLWLMVVVAIVAAALGDSVGYEFGRYFGPRMRASRIGRRIGEERWRKADGFLHRHGGKAVLLGRFTAVLRALTPGVAGAARLPYLRVFLPWNVTGAVLWGGGCVLLGYGFSASLEAVGRYLAWGPIVLVVLLLGGYLVLRWRRSRRETSTRDSVRAEAGTDGADAAMKEP